MVSRCEKCGTVINGGDWDYCHNCGSYDFMQHYFPKEFIEWFTSEKSPVSILYGNDEERFVTTEHDYTIEGLYEHWETTIKK